MPITVLATIGLAGTRDMLDTAKDMKCVGGVSLDPYDFLRLTSPTGVMDFIRQERDETRALDEYNAWALAGKIRVPPFLSIDLDTGRVIGHEGRHRAMALIAAHGSLMRVALRLCRNGYPVYKLESLTGNTEDRHAYLGVTAVPVVWHGEFRPTVTVAPDLRTFKPYFQ